MMSLNLHKLPLFGIAAISICAVSFIVLYLYVPAQANNIWDDYHMLSTGSQVAIMTTLHDCINSNPDIVHCIRRAEDNITSHTMIESGGIPDPTRSIILNQEGSSVPGCEETDDCFVPSTVTINVGEEVVWKNVDTAAHTVTSGVLVDGGPDGIFDSGLFTPGAEFSHMFDTPGEYPYFCLVHPWMSGMIIVQ